MYYLELVDEHEGTEHSRVLLLSGFEAVLAELSAQPGRRFVITELNNM